MHFLYFECPLYIYTPGLPTPCLKVKSLLPILSNFAVKTPQKTGVPCAFPSSDMIAQPAAMKSVFFFFLFDSISVFVACCFYRENPSMPPRCTAYNLHASMEVSRIPAAHSTQCGWVVGAQPRLLTMHASISYYGFRSAEGHIQMRDARSMRATKIGNIFTCSMYVSGVTT